MSNTKRKSLSFDEVLDIARDQLDALEEYIIETDPDIYFIQYSLDREIDGPHGCIFLSKPEHVVVIKRLLNNSNGVLNKDLLEDILRYWLAPYLEIDIVVKENLAERKSNV